MSKDRAKLQWNPLEHSTYRLIKAALSPEHSASAVICVAVSGGLDSMCLLEVLRVLQGALNFELEVVHVHHGEHENALFRNKAKRLVQRVAKLHGLPCRVLHYDAKRPLLSEADLREFRHAGFRRLAQARPCTIALAHHAEDLLLTRLMRLMRGTGLGGLRAMQVWRAPYLRPFLCVGREGLEHYALERRLKYVDDPTNATDFRAWLKTRWLGLLEQKRPGATKALSRSLELLAGAGEEHGRVQAGDELELQELYTHPLGPQGALAEYARHRGLKDYGQTHLLELMKHINRPKKNMSGTILKRRFFIKEDRLYIEDGRPEPESV